MPASKGTDQYYTAFPDIEENDKQMKPISRQKTTDDEKIKVKSENNAWKPEIISETE
jgi:hypothetical protein